MQEIKLDVQIRNDIGTRKVKVLRQQEFIPGVVYGGKRGPTTICLNRRALEKVIREHRSEGVVFHLNVFEGEKKLRDYSSIIKEMQLHPVREDILHVDFKRILLTEKIQVKIPIVAKGEAIGVKKDGGSLDHTMWELEIVCLPTKIPQNIEVDVSELNIGDAVHVNELTLPEDIEVKHEPDAIVLSVVPPMKEEVVEEVEEEEEGELEVIKEKTEEEKAAKAEEKKVAGGKAAEEKSEEKKIEE